MRNIKEKIDKQLRNIASGNSKFPNPFKTANELDQQGKLSYKQIQDIPDEFNFTAEEIIESYVKPKEFLVKKFV